MSVVRRTFLGALGLGAAGAAAQALAQEAPAAVPSALEDEITQRALAHRSRLDFDGAQFSGPAWELLVAEGRASQFFCIGEEHGIAENAKLAGRLFAALAPSGYRHAAIEISPPLAGELDRAARGGPSGVQALFADPGARVAFFGMREEAQWVVDACAAAGGRAQTLWGLDYEVGADRRILQLLAAKRKPAAAARALAALTAASAQSWARYDESRDPRHIYSFAGDAALVQAVRAAWPGADGAAAWMLDTLEETFAINQHWVAGEPWQSNQRRAQFNRANLRGYWQGARGSPRVLFKMGANHMVRGLTNTQVFDVGTQAAEIAAQLGGKSFHVMVLPGRGAHIAQLDPSTWRYNAAEARQYGEAALAPLLRAGADDAFMLVDLRPIRPLVFGDRHKGLDPDLVRAVHGFDALLIMGGSTASQNL